MPVEIRLKFNLIDRFNSDFGACVTFTREKMPLVFANAKHPIFARKTIPNNALEYSLPRRAREAVVQMTEFVLFVIAFPR